jgi:hypothetical protein
LEEVREISLKGTMPIFPSIDLIKQ